MVGVRCKIEMRSMKAHLGAGSGEEKRQVTGCAVRGPGAVHGQGPQWKSARERRHVPGLGKAVAVLLLDGGS